MHGVLDYIENTAERLPRKTAAAYKDVRYTFAELRDAAKRLAFSISERGIKGSAVCVEVERSAETEILLLAAVYSGNYYVPIDPAMPADKISSIISDCGAKLMLGGERGAALCEKLGFGGEFMTLADAGENMLPAPEVEADTPLFLIYTSGSTGKPKGVLKSHGAVISFIEAFAETFDFGENEIIGNQTPFFFDASSKDIYLSLKTGATLEIIPSEMFMLPTALIDYLNQRRITYICWVPTALSMVIQMNAFRKALPETLKNVFFVGEVFPIKQLAAWVSALPDIRYVNLYGSSEIAGICCYYEINPSALPEILPMGKPLCNCELFMENEAGFVAQCGTVGEICISSDALALEYFGDTQKTAERFPEQETPGGTVKRVFKSGDLARYDENGDLVFVSRKDYQIKHLGKRIELGEIESVADRIDEIERCCCLYDSEHQVIRLFCQLKASSELTGKEIKAKLRPMLSDYMLPQKIIVLEEMPYNANGKINRSLLASL